MLTVALTFAFLYAVIWVFERKRELDAFQIASAVIVPIIVYALIMGVHLVADVGPVLDITAFAAFVVATFFMLYKNLELPAGRSAAYTVSVALFSSGMSTFLLYMSQR